MPKKEQANESVDAITAARLLRSHWQVVSDAAALDEGLSYVADARVREDIASSINHPMVTYRFCLPTQLLGKLVNPALDCLRLQRRKDGSRDVTGWDARSLASKVVAPFNAEQENVLGTSADPYVGNPMRIPKMSRDDASKKDVPGWNKLFDILSEVQSRGAEQFTTNVFRQALLEMYRRQKTLHFSYPVPPRVSLDASMELCFKFLAERSGGDRMLAVTGALFLSLIHI